MIVKVIKSCCLNLLIMALPSNNKRKCLTFQAKLKLIEEVKKGRKKNYGDSYQSMYFQKLNVYFIKRQRKKAAAEQETKKQKGHCICHLRILMKTY